MAVASALLGVVACTAPPAAPAPPASAAPSAAALAATSAAALAATSAAAGRAASTWCPAAAAPVAAAGARAVRTLAAARYGPVADTPGGYPVGGPDGDTWVRGASTRWTAGFFPATLWRLYAATSDAAWLVRARRWTDGLLGMASWRGPSAHDLGFVVGLPAALGARLDPSAARRSRYAAAVVAAGRSLSARVSATVHAVVSRAVAGPWAAGDRGTVAVVVDDAVNGLLLLDAARLATGAEAARLRAAGTTHLRTLARVLVRADGSTVHRLAFHPVTGAVLHPAAGQGLDPATSTWTRGQAWAVLGFAEGYAATRDPQLLAAARRTAAYWAARSPGGCVPAWDFDAPAGALRDSSAAAVAADGLLALAAAEPDRAAAARWRAAALATLGTLAGPDWTTASGGAPGVLARQTYNVPLDPREGSYVWGDYYLVAALDAAGR